MSASEEAKERPLEEEPQPSPTVAGSDPADLQQQHKVELLDAAAAGGDDEGGVIDVDEEIEAMRQKVKEMEDSIKNMPSAAGGAAGGVPGASPGALAVVVFGIDVLFIADWESHCRDACGSSAHQ